MKITASGSSKSKCCLQPGASVVQGVLGLCISTRRIQGDLHQRVQKLLASSSLSRHLAHSCGSYRLPGLRPPLSSALIHADKDTSLPDAVTTRGLWWLPSNQIDALPHLVSTCPIWLKGSPATAQTLNRQLIPLLEHQRFMFFSKCLEHSQNFSEYVKCPKKSDSNVSFSKL